MSIAENYLGQSLPAENRAYAGATGKIAAASGRFFALIRLYGGRYRQRRALLSLDDRLLEDIGVTRAQALSEAAKLFWTK